MKKTAIVIVAAAVICIAVISMIFQKETEPPDLVFINDAVQTALQSSSEYESISVLSSCLTKAFETMDAERHSRDHILQFFLYAVVCFASLGGIALCYYCETKFFMPFSKLQHFARHIASGNLEVPLDMDKQNLFGAFTESFDLMREELRMAKENEQKASRQKKELVASLSHDIKTPIASIMSAMDIMLLKTKDEKERKLVESVNIKLEQINSLITNLFQAALEEMQALQVVQREIQSTELSVLIQNADYEKRIMPFFIPDCMVLSDPLRLQQVFDNILHNSYKYACTNIEINSYIEGGSLIIKIQDFGSGVPEEELPLLCNQFYRGTNVKTADGYGLGLHISKYFIEKMSGSLRCANMPDGFAVTIILLLV